MRFYVNTFGDTDNFGDLHHDYDRIGLFDDHGFEGYGNFCGWYSVEKYTNTNLYAWYVAESSPLRFVESSRVSDVKVLKEPIHYDEVVIGSCYWEHIIEADSLEEALVKFKQCDFWKR